MTKYFAFLLALVFCNPNTGLSENEYSSLKMLTLMFYIYIGLYIDLSHLIFFIIAPERSRVGISISTL